MSALREQWVANLYDAYLDDVAFRELGYEERSKGANEQARNVFDHLNSIDHGGVTNVPSRSESAPAGVAIESEFALKMLSVIRFLQVNNCNGVSNVDGLEKILQHLEDHTLGGNKSSSTALSRTGSEYDRFVGQLAIRSSPSPFQGFVAMDSSLSAKKGKSAVETSSKSVIPTKACSELLKDDVRPTTRRTSSRISKKRVDLTEDPRKGKKKERTSSTRKKKVIKRDDHSMSLTSPVNDVPNRHASGRARYISIEARNVRHEMVQDGDIHEADESKKNGDDYWLDPDPFWRCHMATKKQVMYRGT